MNRFNLLLSLSLVVCGMSYSQNAVDLESRIDSGFYILMDDGSIDSAGTAVNYGFSEGIEAVDMALSVTGDGYYVLDADGIVLTFGDAVHYGEPTLESRENVIDIEPTATGLGYYILGDEGKVFTMGDAVFYGESINEDAVDFELAPDGQGYYVLYVDGSLSTFGSAVSFGVLNTGRDAAVEIEIVANGYYILLQSGIVNSFGLAKPFGASLETSEDAVALELTQRGFQLLDSDGAVQSVFQPGRTTAASIARLNTTPAQEVTPTPDIDDPFFAIADDDFEERVIGRIPAASSVPDTLDTGQLSLVSGGVFVLTVPEGSGLVRNIRFYSVEDATDSESEGILFAQLAEERGNAAIRGISYSAQQGIVALVEEFNGTYLIQIQGDFEPAGITGFSMF